MNILKSLSFYTISNVFTKGISLLSMIMLTNIFSIEKYGIITLSNVYLALFMTVLNFGIDAGFQRFYVELKDRQDRNYLFGYVIYIGIILNIISYIILLVLYILTDIFKEIPIYIYMLLVTTASIKSFQNIGLGLIRIKEMAKEYTIINLIISLLDVCLIYIFLYWLKYGLLTRFFILLLINMISIILIFFYLRYEIKLTREKYKDKEILKKFVQYCFPVLMLPIVSWLLTSIDKIMVSKFLSMKEVGVYGFANGIVSNLSIIVTSFLMAYSPIFLKNYNNKELIIKINDMFMNVYTGIIIIFMVFAENIVKLVFKNVEYYESISLFPILAISTLFLAIQSINSSVLCYKYKTKAILIITAISGVTNVFFSYLLINKFGLHGAAISNMLVMFMQMLSGIIYVKRISYSPITNYKLILNILLSLLAIILLYYKFKYIVLLGLIVLIVINMKEVILIKKKLYRKGE